MRVFKGGLVFWFLLFAALSQAAETGEIRGKVAARGVRKPNDAVVYLKKVPGQFAPPAKAVDMDQKDMLFVPHVLPLVQGTTVNFLNSEVKVQHNVFSPDALADRFNLGTYPPGEVRKFTFKKGCDSEQTCVAVALCHVHPEMSAYIVILQNPFFAVTDRTGAFAIKDVPPGTYELVAWHERLREAKQTVTVGNSPLDVTFSLSK